MYIKEVSIDGFKSYAQRVTLSNFDPGFNAITGLNGSGKSNILDAICFVMGIKNLSHVRQLLRARGRSVCAALFVFARARFVCSSAQHHEAQFQKV
jgi:recombinational DNA repair ATPase RecF